MKSLSSLFIAVVVLGSSMCQMLCPQELTVDRQLLWDTIAESKDYYESVSSYSCTIQTPELPDIETVHETELPALDMIFLKPSRYYLSLVDNDGAKQEFIFIEGETHRQFLYPKTYKISGNGSLLYDGQVISIPNNSLSLFYDTIVPVLEQYRDGITWQMEDGQVIDDQQTVLFTVTFPEQVDIAGTVANKISILFDEQRSVPLRISFFDLSDQLADAIVFENLHFDIGITDTFFEEKLITRRREDYMVVESVLLFDEEDFNDPDKLQSFALDLSRIALEKYTAIRDYSAHFIRQERIQGEMQKPEEFFIKFRKPFDLYMKWIAGPNKGWELIYARGKYNNQVVVHVTGLANLFLPTLELDPAGALAMMNNRHSILEFGLGHTIENYYRDVSTAIQLNELDLEYLGEHRVDNRPCWVILSKVPKNSNEYYCYQAKMYFDKEYKLPTKMQFYEWDEQKQEPLLIEIYTYKDLSFNNGYTDKDFDRHNKDYNF